MTFQRPQLLPMLPSREHQGEHPNSHDAEAIDACSENLFTVRSRFVLVQIEKELVKGETERDHRSRCSNPGHQRPLIGKECAIPGQLHLIGWRGCVDRARFLHVYTQSPSSVACRTWLPFVGRRIAPYDACFTPGGFQEPSRIDGLLSLGQYIRSMRMNFPAGAGSQLASFSGPGDWCWM
jgi:hypothetical protein